VVLSVDAEFRSVVLHYYKPTTKEAPVETGSSMITGTTTIVSPDEKNEIKDKFAFTVTTEDKVFHFSAPSLEARSEWVHVLEDAKDLSAPGVPPKDSSPA
jgi:hypothetical protein